MDWLILAIVMPLIIVVAIVLIVAIAKSSSRSSRDKQLVCSECGHVFDAPVWDQKLVAGWTLPGMGLVECPKCGVKRSRNNYAKVEKTVKTA